MATNSSTPLVLVTGASGFVATHLIKQLQLGGKYRVRGTLRSLDNEEKVKELKNLVPEAAHPLELVEANLLDEGCWKKAVQDCDFVFHVASPCPAATPRDENDLIAPAVNGTLNVLKACSETAGTVKRVVLTSSVVAIADVDDSHVHTEDDWSNDEPRTRGYVKSKIRAERAAWEFVAKLEGDKKFELATVNPGGIFGPVLTKSTGSASVEIIESILDSRMAVIPDLMVSLIDVRDVALAHIAALEVAEAAGHRHIVVERHMSLKDIASLISDEFSPQGYSISTRGLPKFLAWSLSFVNKQINSFYPTLGKNVTYSNERLKNVLGLEPRNATIGVIDSCYSLIETGHVPKKAGYLGPASSRGEGIK